MPVIFKVAMLNSARLKVGFSCRVEMKEQVLARRIERRLEVVALGLADRVALRDSTLYSQMPDCWLAALML